MNQYASLHEVHYYKHAVQIKATWFCRNHNNVSRACSAELPQLWGIR